MFERLLDRTNLPSMEDLARYCGENGERFRALNDRLSTQYRTVQEIRFPYGKRYGWCITHRKGKKLICDVFAEDNAFTVMLRLSDAQFASVYASLGAYAKAYIDDRYPCGDGGWIRYRVACAEHFPDIVTLLDVKCR